MTDTPPLKALPTPETREGKTRRVGVEIEFGGVAEDRVSEIVREVFGGEVGPRDDKGYLVSGTELGDIAVYLDTQYLHRAETRLDETIHAIARTVVPVEIVTGPLEIDQIAALDRLVVRLREEGATGTASGLFLGFGVHFNPEVVSLDLADVLPVLRAFAFCEDALRRAAGIDLARRLMPFVDPFPRALVDGLAEQNFPDMAALIDLFLDRAPSRNHGLDMMCIFAEVDADRLSRKLDMALIGARPTFHYRLPDCRIDEPDWSLALEWNRWARIEEIAAQPDMLDELAEGWKAHRSALTTMRRDWAPRVTEITGGVS